MRLKASIAAVAALVVALGTASAASAVGTAPSNAASPLSTPADFHGPQVWTGYVDVGHAVTFKSVTADLKVPPVGCTSLNSKASFWIGLDGYGSPTVEQVGISTDCFNGTPQVRAWYEMYPKGTVYQFPVLAGDSIAMAVTYDGGSEYSLALKDLTRPASKFSKAIDCPSGQSCENLTAEAVLEADNGRNLSTFGTNGFTEFQAVTNTGVRTGLDATSSWGLAKLLMTGANGKPLATLSAITNNHENFSLSYQQPR